MTLGWPWPFYGKVNMGRLYINIIFKIIFSETPGPIKVKFHRKHLYEGGTNMYIDNTGHMTKMAAVHIYGKNPSKLVGTAEPTAMKLDM